MKDQKLKKKQVYKHSVSLPVLTNVIWSAFKYNIGTLFTKLLYNDVQFGCTMMRGRSREGVFMKGEESGVHKFKQGQEQGRSIYERGRVGSLSLSRGRSREGVYIREKKQEGEYM